VAVLVQLSGSIGIAIKWWLGIVPSANEATPCGGFQMNSCKRTINQLGNYWQFIWMDFLKICLFTDRMTGSRWTMLPLTGGCPVPAGYCCLQLFACC